MKKTTGSALKIWSFIMILGGIISIVLDVMLMISRFREPGLSRFVLLLGILLLLACGILELAEGIKSLLYINNSLRERRFRALNNKIRTFKQLTIAAILCCLAEVILSVAVGIIFWQLAVMIGAGILIPLINLLCIRSLQS